MAFAFLARVSAGDVPSPPPPPDEVVRLEQFNVTTSIGSYSDPVSDAATKTPIALQDLSSSVQIINAAFISDVRAERLDDLYTYAVGLYRENAGQANGFNMRGFTMSGALTGTQVDGLPGLTTRYASPPTADVERLEIIKGASSVLYGELHPGGLVNIVTKSPQEIASASLTTFVTTYDAPDVATTRFGDRVSGVSTLDATGPIDAAKHWLYRLIVSGEDIHSFRDYYFEHNVYWYPSLTYRLDGRTAVTVKLDITRQHRQANDGLVVPDNNLDLLPPINVTQTQPNDLETDVGEALGLNFRHAFGESWVLQFNGRSSWHEDKRVAEEYIQGTIVNAVPYENSTVTRRFRDQYNGRRNNFGDLNLAGTVGPPVFRNHLIFGVDTGKEWNDFNRYAFGPAITPPVDIYVTVPNTTSYPLVGTSASDPKTTFYNYSEYAADQITIAEKLHAALGLHHYEQATDYYEVYTGKTFHQVVSTTIPHFGVLYQPIAALSLYADFARSFTPQVPTAVNANDLPGFAPETGRQWEEGIKIDLFDHRLITTVATYDIVKHNVVESTGVLLPSGDTISALSGEQESKGLEWEADYQPVKYWQIKAGYSYIDARVNQSVTVSEDGRLLPNVPHNGGNLWTRYNVPGGPFKGVGLGFGEIYVGRRLGYAANVISANPALWLLERSYARSDLAIFYSWGHLDLSLNVQNIFDKIYIEDAFYNSSVVVGDPRKLTLAVKLSL